MKEQWFSVDCGSLLLATEEQLVLANSVQAASSSVTKASNGWDVQEHLLDSITRIQQFLPVVRGLHSPSMRPRHWKQVYDTYVHVCFVLWGPSLQLYYAQM